MALSPKQLSRIKSKARVPEHAYDFYYAFQQYRAGRSIQECADDIGVDRSALFDRISKEGITQDLALLIRNKTTDILAGDYVAAGVSGDLRVAAS